MRSICLRATRRLDQLRQAQAATIELGTGGEHGGRARIDGVRATPSIIRPTLAMQGIDKNLAKQARVLGKLSDEKFEARIADARAGLAGLTKLSSTPSPSSRNARPTARAPRAALSMTSSPWRQADSALLSSPQTRPGHSKPTRCRDASAARIATTTL